MKGQSLNIMKGQSLNNSQGQRVVQSVGLKARMRSAKPVSGA